MFPTLYEFQLVLMCELYEISHEKPYHEQIIVIREKAKYFFSGNSAFLGEIPTIKKHSANASVL